MIDFETRANCSSYAYRCANTMSILVKEFKKKVLAHELAKELQLVIV